MLRKQVMLTPRQIEHVQSLAALSEITFSEMIRRLLDEDIGRYNKIDKIIRKGEALPNG